MSDDKRPMTAGQMRTAAGVPEVYEYPAPAVAPHHHFYRWSEVKAARHGGPRPRCLFCGADQTSTPEPVA